ncbi:MAG: ABC transporter permease, partial [Hominenteromicrobium sp.]
SMFVGSDSGAENFEELMVGADSTVSRVVTDSYELLYGAWPERYDEVVLVLDGNNSIPTEELYQLGILSADEYRAITKQIENGEEPDAFEWDYAEICDRSFYLVPACDRYEENDDGTFSLLDDSTQAEQLLENSLELKITGVIRPAEGAANATLTAPVAYTSKLTDYVIEHTNESAIVCAQEKTPETNVLNGMAFEEIDDAKKAEDAADYVSALGVSDKASLYKMILYYNSNKEQEEAQTAEAADPDALQQMQAAGGMPEGMSGQAAASIGAMDETAMAAALDAWLENTPDEEILLSLYDQYIAGSTYEDNMKNFGKISYDAPDSISIYTDSFENKEMVSDCIERYNETVEEDSRITYTDYVALLTSSITSIVDVISYVLIAFVAVSLIVSCIMISIITHISVLERTKEIGILRALGASKRNISQVFNAETFIIGFCAGLIGVGISALLTIPINAVIANLIGTETVRAVLPVGAAVILVAISMVITILAGLVPAKSAAKKDPVTALRTE